MTQHKRTKAQVMHGTCKKTSGGLTKKDIKTVRKKGQKHYVSKKKSALAKKNLGPWNRAVAKAKKALGIGKHEFVVINRGPIGKKLYVLAAQYYY